MTKDNAIEALELLYNQTQGFKPAGMLEVKNCYETIRQALEAKDDDQRQYMHPDEMMRLVAENLKEEAKDDPIDKMKGKL